MDNSVYKETQIDFLKEPLFLGTGKNTQRYDILKYPFFDNTNEKMLGQFWQPMEIDVSRDKRDFHNLPENMKSTYTKVLQKLIFLDSVQGRGMSGTFGQFITNPEFESAMKTWEFFENIHSRSYTHILRSVYENPSEIFDESFRISELTGLAKQISTSYDNCFQKGIEYLANPVNDTELKKSILLLLIEINILEGIRFYSGFATIWSMHYSQGYMERTSNILKLIARDENIHLQITQYTLKLLKDSSIEGFTEIYREIENKIPEIYENACVQEFQWIDFLFKEGSFLGMSPELAKNYLKYICNRRLRAIGQEGLFAGFTKNPIPWVETYINYDTAESLPQETEILNYRFDLLDKSISESKIKNLKDLLS